MKNCNFLIHILVKWIILLHILLLLFNTLQIKSVLQKEMMNYIFVISKQVSIKTDDSICNPLGCEIVQNIVQHALEDHIGETSVESVFYHPSHSDHYTQCNLASLLQ